jgi:hypothetical protein
VTTFIIDPANGYRFACGDVGADDFTEFMLSLPRIDLIYNSPPSRDLMSWWHAHQPLPYTYGQFFDSLVGLWRQADPDEIYVEANKEMSKVRTAIDQWGKFPHVDLMPITYAAPADGTSKRMARTRSPYQLLRASIRPLPDFAFTHSDDFLEQLLSGRPAPLNVFDPCIGKGMLLRAAFAHGHHCYGIEPSSKRLSCCAEWIQKQIPDREGSTGVEQPAPKANRKVRVSA